MPGTGQDPAAQRRSMTSLPPMPRPSRFAAGPAPLRRLLVLCAYLTSATTASAQVARPFVFTVTTTGAAADAGSRTWTAYYDTGYAERSAGPFGYDGLEQSVGFQGRLGSRYTVLGRVAFGVGGEATRSSQEAEVLRDLLGPAFPVRLAIGLGARREWQGTSTALGRLCIGWNGRRSLLFGNLRFERPFAQGRDAVDLVSTFGWLQRVSRGWRVGIEAVGEDLEGLWEADEAEGGAKLYAGPALHWASSTERLWLSASGGPVVYASRSGRTSPAPRPLDAGGNAFTLRASIGYTF